MFVRRDLPDTVPTPEGDMHYVKKGSGYPLVMLHPLGTSTWAWSAVIDSLSQHYTCYAFDMLGHGESEKPKRHFNIPDYALALDHACQLLNIHRGHYLGNSVGAILATEMAASFAGPRYFWPRPSAAGYDGEGIPKPRSLQDTKESTTFAQPQQEWVDAMNGTRAQAGVWVRNLMEALAHYDVMSRLPRIQASSTLVMYGEVDRLRDGEELLHNNIVNASKVVLPGLGHIPQIEDPEAFVGALLPFLES